VVLTDNRRNAKFQSHDSLLADTLLMLPAKFSTDCPRSSRLINVSPLLADFVAEVGDDGPWRLA
jgi:hypothetical protein